LFAELSKPKGETVMLRKPKVTCGKLEVILSSVYNMGSSVVSVDIQ
jgi:hypothetical protein